MGSREDRLHRCTDTGATPLQRFVCDCCAASLPSSSFDPLPFARTLSKSAPRAPGLARCALLRTVCTACRRAQADLLRHNASVTPAVRAFWRRKMSSLKQGALTRGILVAIDEDDLVQLFLKQEGRCALSGLALDIAAVSVAGRGGRAELCPSVDRIDSHGNYILGNVQILAQVVNIMKNDVEEGRFVDLCRAIASCETRRQRDREDDLLHAISST